MDEERAIYLTEKRLGGGYGTAARLLEMQPGQALRPCGYDPLGSVAYGHEGNHGGDLRKIAACALTKKKPARASPGGLFPESA